MIVIQTRRAERLIEIEEASSTTIAAAHPRSLLSRSVPTPQRIAGVAVDGATRVYATADGLPLRDFSAASINDTSDFALVADSLCVSAPRHRSELFSVAENWQLERTIEQWIHRS